MSCRTGMIILVLQALLLGATWQAGYAGGWYACSERVRADKTKSEGEASRKTVATEAQAMQANRQGRVIYRTIYRDVIRYVEKKGRRACPFDAESVRLRQRAIDAANNIPGFDAPALQSQ